MNPMKQEKKKHNMLNNILSTLVLCFVLVMIFWLPTLCSSISLLFMESLPRFMQTFLSPKCLFLIFNLIVVFLVSESRMSSSTPSKTTTDVYDEYMMHTQSRLKSVVVQPSVEEKKDQNEVEFVGSDLLIEDKKLDVVVEERQFEEELIEEEEEEEETGLATTEELNRRFEGFIARVNMQRRLEAARVSKSQQSNFAERLSML